MKEGSNRSLFEAMFCNTPVLCLVDNLGVNKAYINEYTGMLFWDKHLANALLSMRRNWTRFRPREWAMANISPEISTEKLCNVISNNANDDLLIKDINKRKNILIKVNRPEIEYLDYPKFNKIKFNSKLIELFLNSNCLVGIDSKLKELKHLFEAETSKSL
jgi:hypothetical protein